MVFYWSLSGILRARLADGHGRNCGKEKLSVYLPIAFGDMEVAGYEAVYDLSPFPGQQLKVTYHRFGKSGPTKVSYAKGDSRAGGV